MPPLGLLIKPASSNCNLSCKYCFYHSITENRRIKSYGMMSLKTLEILVRKALLYAEYSCTFVFQGGEPTLVGLDFYKVLIELENKFNIKKLKIFNAIQTNGIVIDDKWAEFLADKKFLVGLSLDGPGDIHDINRIDANNKGSFQKIMNTVNLFNKYHVEFNILFVVNSVVVRHSDKIYKFFKKHKFNYLQFIPCLDPINKKPGDQEYSLKPDAYASFLKNLFNLWYEDLMKGNRISIRYFDNIIGMVMGYKPEACGILGVCQSQLIIEADGGVYPCDFYVIDDWHLGNIKEVELDELKNSDKSKRFIEMSKFIDPQCKACKWFNLCRGGCRRNREPFKDENQVLNYYCSSYREFFEAASERINNFPYMTRRSKILSSN